MKPKIKIDIDPNVVTKFNNQPAEIEFIFDGEPLNFQFIKDAIYKKHEYDLKHAKGLLIEDFFNWGSFNRCIRFDKETVSIPRKQGCYNETFRS